MGSEATHPLIPTLVNAARALDHLSAALVASARALDHLSLCQGDLSNSQRNFQRNLRAPLRPGDLVFEFTTSCDSRRDAATSLGILDRVVWEPFPSGEGLEPDPEARERVFYIRRLDTGEEVRWVNADFRRIPADVEEAETLFQPRLVREMTNER